MPAFLDRNLKTIDLFHGVSFASASSGYDDLTANFSVRKQKKKKKTLFSVIIVALKTPYGFQLTNEVIELCTETEMSLLFKQNAYRTCCRFRSSWSISCTTNSIYPDKSATTEQKT